MQINLSNRLQALANQGLESYEHIWDCCCDHGLLGQYLMTCYPQARVHFVDQVAAIMEPLQSLLRRKFADLKWQTHCEDLNSLVLPEKQSKHLVIIAGVGGDLAVQFVERLLSNNPAVRIDFLLCPVRQNYWLRTQLGQHGLKSLHEEIIVDNGHYYELLHLSLQEGDKLSRTGNRMWNLGRPEHRHYLSRIIRHYQKMQQGKPDEAAPALRDYQRLEAGLMGAAT